MLETAALAFAGVFTVKSLLFLTIGMLVGLVVGVIPGIGGTAALAILGPLTLGLQPAEAMSLAGGIMGAVSFGGSVTSILINLPGGAPNAATCLDGYPMAQQGRAGAALGASASASSIGGVIGIFTLLLVMPLSRRIILSFGPPEFFLLTLLGLVTIAVCVPGKMLRGLVVGGFGLMFAMVGFDGVNGGERYTFGNEYLWDGIPLAPTLIGLFAFPEMIRLSASGGSIARRVGELKLDDTLEGVWASFRHWKTVLRGSIIGTCVGAVPGVGGTVSAFIAYSSTVQASKNPESFGRGNIEGVIAPEAANNAKDGGSLLPTLAFGIPGSAEMAVFLSLLVLHGMQPGPQLLLQHEDVIFALIISLTLASVLASVIGLALIRPLAAITMLDGQIMVPMVIAVSLLGAYTTNLQPGDIVVACFFGVLGYLMNKFEYPRLTLVIALVLGELSERSFHQSLLISRGSPTIFVSRTVSLILIALIVFSIFLPIVRALLRRSRPAAAEATP